MIKINQHDWELHFTRFRRPLIAASIQGGWQRFDYPVDNIIVNSSEVYFNKKQYRRSEKLFLKKASQNPRLLLNIARSAYKEFAEKNLWLNKFERKDFKNYSNAALAAILEKNFKWLYDWNKKYVPPPNIAEESLLVRLQKELARFVDPVKNFAEFQRIQLLLSIPARPGFLEQYEAKLKEAKMACGRLPALLEKAAADLEKKFGWLGDTGRLEFWDADTIKKQIIDQKIIAARSGQRPGAEEELLKLGADARLKQAVRNVREYAYFRTFRIDVNLIFCYRARRLFKEIAKRLYLPLESLSYLSSAEAARALINGRLPGDLNARKKGFAIILSNGKTQILSGEKATMIAKLIRGTKKERADILTGTTACSGKVRGAAKLVYTSAEAGKVKNGDILISPMTKPELVAAMKRSGAIVTDEGGLTCHAAIVSRELGIPCVIGTKVATKVFKDGDLVEVDAEKGIVKKI